MREDKLTEKAISYRDEWFEQYPKLKIAYALKESFYRIYDCSTRFEAERAFREWQRQIPSDTDFNGWRLMASTVRRHRKPIFNYFDVPYTNAFVEGLTVSFALYPMKDVAMISTFSVVRYFCQRDEKSKPRKQILTT